MRIICDLDSKKQLRLVRYTNNEISETLKFKANIDSETYAKLQKEYDNFKDYRFYLCFELNGYNRIDVPAKLVIKNEEVRIAANPLLKDLAIFNNKVVDFSIRGHRDMLGVRYPSKQKVAFHSSQLTINFNVIGELVSLAEGNILYLEDIEKLPQFGSYDTLYLVKGTELLFWNGSEYLSTYNKSTGKDTLMYDIITWNEKNTVLLAGQLGFDSTNERLKIGNGTAPWRELNYVGERDYLAFKDSLSEVAHTGEYEDLINLPEEDTFMTTEDIINLF